jgi:2-methylcitrate dehydratase
LRPEPDKVLQDIADYVHSYKIESELAYETARLSSSTQLAVVSKVCGFPAVQNSWDRLLKAPSFRTFGSS